MTDNTRESWNIATANHNRHKGDQVAFFVNGGETLFAEELALLGGIDGQRLLHLQCNAGQDTLSLARRGAKVTGVDLSDEAIGFARHLSHATGIGADFVQAEALGWLQETDQRFDVVFSSYGAVGWLKDLTAWANGIARVLVPAGRFVYVEFHPTVWSVGKGLALTGDDYFCTTPFQEPVTDYVATSGAGLLATPGEPLPNTVPATSFQHTLADTVQALLDAQLILTTLKEWPYANGCRVNPNLVLDEQRRYHWPQGTARLPLMFGVVCQRP